MLVIVWVCVCVVCAVQIESAVVITRWYPNTIYDSQQTEVTDSKQKIH